MCKQEPHRTIVDALQIHVLDAALYIKTMDHVGCHAVLLLLSGMNTSGLSTWREQQNRHQL